MKQTAIIIATLLLLASCGNDKPNLDDRVFGVWVENIDYKLNPEQNIFVFKSDGTYTALYPDSYYGDINDQGTYTTKEALYPERWKFGACVVDLESKFGNNYELEFRFGQDTIPTAIYFYKITTSRDGVRTVADDFHDIGFYERKDLVE